MNPKMNNLHYMILSQEERAELYKKHTSPFKFIKPQPYSPNVLKNPDKKDRNSHEFLQIFFEKEKALFPKADYGQQLSQPSSINFIGNNFLSKSFFSQTSNNQYIGFSDKKLKDLNTNSVIGGLSLKMKLSDFSSPSKASMKAQNHALQSKKASIQISQEKLQSPNDHKHQIINIEEQQKDSVVSQLYDESKIRIVKLNGDNLLSRNKIQSYNNVGGPPVNKNFTNYMEKISSLAMKNQTQHSDLSQSQLIQSSYLNKIHHQHTFTINSIKDKNQSEIGLNSSLLPSLPFTHQNRMGSFDINANSKIFSDKNQYNNNFTKSFKTTQRDDYKHKRKGNKTNSPPELKIHKIKHESYNQDEFRKAGQTFMPLRLSVDSNTSRRNEDETFRYLVKVSNLAGNTNYKSNNKTNISIGKQEFYQRSPSLTHKKIELQQHVKPNHKNEDLNERRNSSVMKIEASTSPIGSAGHSFGQDILIPTAENGRRQIIQVKARQVGRRKMNNYNNEDLKQVDNRLPSILQQQKYSNMGNHHLKSSNSLDEWQESNRSFMSSHQQIYHD
ncbi:UNKNOWN [Stylonychia lemnae]|uniref:Uncharacterized protein n=1 Tax=Stylonychia lemnae TaxID=5949 RepID=A0A078A2K4_STYLE|nr:UNKNOWN [Stylonychia lemnae]|eukprot:CDW76052.1 UNKNOWN [Stylonychia lemnae]